MNQSAYDQNRQRLQLLMQQAGISSLKELSRLSGISQWQLSRVEHGLLPKMNVETLLKLADALQVAPSQLLTLFCPASTLPSVPKQEEESAAIASLKQEYQRLQQQMEQQRAVLREEFQQSSLEILESWLLQWPTATVAVQKHPQLPAVKLLPLVKPVEKLLKQWGVEAIASVGEAVAYDPQCHQLIEGTAQPGDLVKVRYVGYRQGDKLLYRAKVSPVKDNQDSQAL